MDYVWLTDQFCNLIEKFEDRMSEEDYLVASVILGELAGKITN